MTEGTTNAGAAENNATQGAPAEPERKFTQSEMDAIIGERLARERSKYADYDELKAKAQQFDDAEEAKKSELQKVVEERDRYKAEAEAAKAEKERSEAIAKAAAEHGVDAALLARMNGDVEENAKYLADKAANEPKFGKVPDSGEPAKSTPQKVEIPSVI